MAFFYHASQTGNLQDLRPFVSNHGVSQIYLSSKRENVLVYLSNAVEKYCKETGYCHEGKWYKWASYGFDKQGKMQIEEYYPNALVDTYQNVSGYLYSVSASTSIEPMQEIQDAYVSSQPLECAACEYIEDAYAAIIEAEKAGLISIVRFHQLTEGQLEWLEKTIVNEYLSHNESPDYKYFLRGKFPEFLREISNNMPV